MVEEKRTVCVAFERKERNAFGCCARTKRTQAYKSLRSDQTNGPSERGRSSCEREQRGRERARGVAGPRHVTEPPVAHRPAPRGAPRAATLPARPPRHGGAGTARTPPPHPSTFRLLRSTRTKWFKHPFDTCA